MRQLLHPNILHCLHSYVTGPTVCVVMPFMSLGSVRSAMEAVSGWEQGLPEVACAKVLGDVTQALAYLHSKSVIHRSVRCSHILLTQATSQQVSSKEELSLGGSFSFVAKLSGLRYACSLHDPPGIGRHLTNFVFCYLWTGYTDTCSTRSQRNQTSPCLLFLRFAVWFPCSCLLNACFFAPEF